MNFKAVGCGVSQKYQNWGKNGKWYKDVPIYRPITHCRQQIACNSTHLFLLFFFYIICWFITFLICVQGSWSYCCWIYNYLCNQWLSLIFTLVSSIYKTDCHDITEMLLKVALSTINLSQNLICIHKENYRSDLDTILTDHSFLCLFTLAVVFTGSQ